MNEQDERRFERMERELEELRATVTRLASPLGGPGQTTTLETRSTRRGILKLAGTGAAAAGVAAATGLLNATPAAATIPTPPPVNLGTSNPASSVTQIENTTLGDTAFWGLAHGPFSEGTRGESLLGTGVLGHTDSGTGIVGEAQTSGMGVFGTSNTGPGGVFISASGIDVYAKGTGRIRQVSSGFVGAPTSGVYGSGEMVRDNNGDLFLCIANGTPGIWKKVAAGAPGFDARSGSINFLTAPIRLLDTRPGQAAASGGLGPYLANSNNDLQVGSVLYQGLRIPAGAIGVVGNVTVANPAAAGFLTIYPQGSPKPLSSSLNYGPGQVVNNATVAGLSPASGQLTIYTLASTDVIFDAVGFMF